MKSTMEDAMRKVFKQELPVNTEDSGHMQEFMEYCAKYGKSYDNREELMVRLHNYFDTDKRIKEAMI